MECAAEKLLHLPTTACTRHALQWAIVLHVLRQPWQQAYLYDCTQRNSVQNNK